MLCGDIEPNPGPFRGQLDLTVGFVAATSQRMARCLEGFKIWVRDVAEIDWLPLTEDPQALAIALRAYGLYCFEHGHPRYLFVYAITATQDLFPLSRSFMSVAWQIDKKWQIHEPGTSRAVLPALVVRAAV